MSTRRAAVAAASIALTLATLARTGTRPRWPRTSPTMAPTSAFSSPGIRPWSAACSKRGRAGPVARGGAIVQSSVFDAVNGVTGRYTPYFETRASAA